MDELRDQIRVINEWVQSSVAITIALYEADTPPEDLERKVIEVGEIIFERVMGNRIKTSRVLVWDDDSIRKLYKRVVEATLRWCIERTFE